MADEPQRHRIELKCPECGHTQLEPALVVSTLCRSCRAHLQVRDGQAVRRAQSITKFAKLREDGSPEVVVPPTSSNLPPPASPPGVTRRFRAEPTRQPWWWKLIFRPKPPREIICLGCSHPFSVVAGAQSSQCPKCCTYANFTDFHIDQPSNRRIETRGNVTIGKKGIYTGPAIRCHHLKVIGVLAAPVEITGELILRHNLRLCFPVHCGHLRVTRRVKVEFLHPVTATTATIAGEARGQITCSESLTLEKRAHFHGLVRTRSLITKPGAKHTGTTEMLPEPIPDIL